MKSFLIEAGVTVIACGIVAIAILYVVTSW